MVDIIKKLWNMTHIIPLKIVGKHAFIKPITQQYPEEKIPVAPRFKGRQVYHMDICLGCMACARACPNDTIDIKVTMVEDEDGKKKKVIERFNINMGRCMFCGLCVDACPKSVLVRGKDYELAAYSREELIYGPDRLGPEEEAEVAEE